MFGTSIHISVYESDQMYDKNTTTSVGSDRDRKGTIEKISER